MPCPPTAPNSHGSGQSQASTAAASIALIPLPVADMIPLLGVQTGLILTIARIYGYDITPARAKELIAAFGLGFVARTVYRQMIKLLGAPGWILSSAVAASATVANWLRRDVLVRARRAADPRGAAEAHSDITVYLRDQLLRGGKDRPDQKGLAKRVQGALEGLPDQFRPDSAPEDAARRNRRAARFATHWLRNRARVTEWLRGR